MRSQSLLVAAAVVAVGVAASCAGAAEQAGRYTMQATDGGFLRLDTVTGDMSLCQSTAGGFECKPVKDDRDLQAEVARLQAENKRLEAEIKRLDEQLGLDGGSGARREPRKFELPSEQDVDKALSYVERMLRKFRDKLKDLESSGPAAPAPETPGKGAPEEKDGVPGKGTRL